MKTMIVGGDIGKNKPSNIVLYLGIYMPGTVEYFNGVLPGGIGTSDLVLWMPQIDNIERKVYPKKQQGAVLICSKVMREGYTHVDSVSRIFRMGANAVIEIYPSGTRPVFAFELRDALNNRWGERTTDLKALARYIKEFYEWSKGSTRVSLKKGSLTPDIRNPLPEWEEFLKLNEELALKVAQGCGNRYFGNYSTRCTRLFPSINAKGDFFLFSGRNTPKDHISLSDMVLCSYSHYFGDHKPSVDTPIQLEIYKEFPSIKYMIHGHAFAQGAVTTREYFPCGDMREVPEVMDLIGADHRAINLNNHGFLIVGQSVEEIRDEANSFEFVALEA